MNADRELKIVFTGPMGAGKTTAIRAISDAPPVSTEVANTDQATVATNAVSRAATTRAHGRCRSGLRGRRGWSWAAS